MNSELFQRKVELSQVNCGCKKGPSVETDWPLTIACHMKNPEMLFKH